MLNSPLFCTFPCPQQPYLLCRPTVMSYALYNVFGFILESKNSIRFKSSCSRIGQPRRADLKFSQGTTTLFSYAAQVAQKIPLFRKSTKLLPWFAFQESYSILKSPLAYSISVAGCFGIVHATWKSAKKKTNGTSAAPSRTGSVRPSQSGKL